LINSAYVLILLLICVSALLPWRSSYPHDIYSICSVIQKYKPQRIFIIRSVLRLTEDGFVEHLTYSYLSIYLAPSKAEERCRYPDQLGNVTTPQVLCFMLCLCRICGLILLTFCLYVRACGFSSALAQLFFYNCYFYYFTLHYLIY